MYLCYTAKCQLLKREKQIDFNSFWVQLKDESLGQYLALV